MGAPQEVIEAALTEAIDTLTRLKPTLYRRPSHQRRAVLEAAAGFMMDLRAAGVITIPGETAERFTDQVALPLDPADQEILDAYEAGDDRP